MQLYEMPWFFQYAFTHWGSESGNQEWFDKIKKTAEGSQYIQGSCSIKEFDSFYDYTAEKPNVTYTDSVSRVPAMLVLKLLQIEEVEFNLKKSQQTLVWNSKKTTNAATEYVAVYFGIKSYFWLGT